MIVIAESSTTKTEWCLVDGNKIVDQVITDGLNPLFLSRREISHIIRLDLPASFFKRRWEQVYFYGAGCVNEEKKKIIEASIVAQFKTPTTVESDLLGAARGLLVRDSGLACILGTGSNSCLYDGKEIVRNVRSLGFILGDEGSGATLGRLLLSDCLKGLAPADICSEFLDRFALSADTVMDQIYNNPLANRNLGHFSTFLADHLDSTYVRELVFNEFSRFFTRNVMQYDYRNNPICFVGQVACVFSEILCDVAEAHGAYIKKIVHRSMPGIIKFHSTESR